MKIHIWIKRFTPVFISLGYQNYKRKKRITLYHGDKIACPVCGLKFEKLAPFGKRMNACCPNCGSMDRQRLLWRYLKEKTDLFNKKIRLLHFAPEKGFYDNFTTLSNMEYIPCDYTPWIYRYDRKNKLIKVDVTNIPFKENSFDVIICNHILEHVIDDALAMSELYRVLKKGGWAILQVPIDNNRETTYEDFTITTPKEREKAFGQYDHVRYYGRDYKNRLEKAGFKVNVNDYFKSLSPEDLQQNGISSESSELIYHCRK